MRAIFETDQKTGVLHWNASSEVVLRKISLKIENVPLLDTLVTRAWHQLGLTTCSGRRQTMSFRGPTHL